ncbi:MAG TPA: SH3 domain-containing protein [Polyangiaceae bacterium]|jgi:hypothetical protein
MMGRSSRPLTVQIPSETADRPSWIKVGAIAVIGFTIGVAWPRLVGIRPGPSAPSEATGGAAVRAPETPLPNAAASLASTGPSATASASAAPTASANDAAVPLNNAPPAILATHGAVLSCKTTDGEVLKGQQACGSVPAFDGLAHPRLKKLAHCPGAQGLSGKLGVVFSLDFTRNKVGFSFGKNSTVGNRDSLDQCLRMSLENVSLNAVAHDNPTYAVFYSVTFTPRDSVPSTGAAVAAAEGPEPGAVQTAQVAWEVALVRDKPRDGQVVGRLQRGTKVHVGAGQDGWYKVQFGTDFGSEGWVYRGAIGR